MRKLGLVVISIILVLTYGCDPTQGSFEESVSNHHILTTNVIPDEGGSVHPPDGEYPAGEDLLIEARPAEGYIFNEWSEDLNGNTNPASLLIDGNKSVTAHFILRDYNLNIEIIGEGYIRELEIERSPDITVELEAVAEEGWFFDRWEGDLAGNNNPETITIGEDEEKNVTAVFESEEFGSILNIEQVKLFVTEFELDGRRSTQDYTTENFIATLPLDGSPFTLTHEEIPSGSYDQFELEIEKPDDNVDVGDSDFRDETGSYSLVVKGTYHDNSFRFRSAEGFDIDVDLDPPVEITQNQQSLIVIDVDVGSWFKNADGDFVDPSDTQHTEMINDNIERSFKEFEEEFENQ